MPSPRLTRPAARLPALDGLRGLAALAVVVLHVWMFDFGDGGHPAKDVADRALGELRLGVPLFFVLSGFLLYRAYAGPILDGRPLPSVRRFALARGVRILPGYWLALAGAIAITALLRHPRAISAGELPAFLLFAHNQFDATRGQLDPPLWSLGVEVSFYVLLPVLALALRRLGPRRWAHLLVIAALAGLGVAFDALAEACAWPPTVTTSLLGHLPDFAGGMAVAVALHGRRLSRGAGVAAITAGVALVLLDGLWHGWQWGPRLPRLVLDDDPAVAGFALVVAGLAGAPGRARLLGSRPAALLGDLSYAMYLWHFPVILWLRGTERWPQDLGGALTATLALTVAVSAVSWFLVERPALRWAARRRTARRPVARSASRTALAG